MTRQFKGSASRAYPVLAALTALALTGCAVTPTPMSLGDRQATLAADRQAMFGSQEPLAGPVTLQEAMARALKYNLDYRVKLMEEAMAQRQLDLSSLDMLPAGAGRRLHRAQQGQRLLVAERRHRRAIAGAVHLLGEAQPHRRPQSELERLGFRRQLLHRATAVRPHADFAAAQAQGGAAADAAGA